MYPRPVHNDFAAASCPFLCIPHLPAFCVMALAYVTKLVEAYALLTPPYLPCAVNGTCFFTEAYSRRPWGVVLFCELRLSFCCFECFFSEPPTLKLLNKLRVSTQLSIFLLDHKLIPLQGSLCSVFDDLLPSMPQSPVTHGLLQDPFQSQQVLPTRTTSRSPLLSLSEPVPIHSGFCALLSLSVFLHWLRKKTGGGLLFNCPEFQSNAKLVDVQETAREAVG